MHKRFSGSFTQQSALPEASLRAAERVLGSAALHRYQTDDGQQSETACLEQEFANWQGADYCLAVASGGQAMQLALRAAGVAIGDPVLTNAFTLAPVPGAIRAVGAAPVLVEITRDLVIDLDDLEQKVKSSGAKVLLLSHMRGHIPDMTAIMQIVQAADVTVIEDCAHTMGATWQGEKSGNFGTFGCFSTQTYKHMNSGEGGLLTTGDPTLAAKAIIMSGSYMNYDRHGAMPGPMYFADAKYDCPNMSARMDNLRAAILRPQLERLDEAVAGWNQRAKLIAEKLLGLSPYVYCPKALDGAMRVGSSIQFCLPGQTAAQCQAVVRDLATRGVEVKWFGHAEPHGFTSQHKHWRYMDAQSLPQTDEVIQTLFDMRVPLSFDEADCLLIADILVEVLQAQAIAGEAA
ncbi:DegT/DnrJ/EryC1/StrS family aminotransferase [Yoonia sp. BS5-3]|uniref:DegT/DnrJ/EryC1/StrS family aminotransferase n=1 Tax=Yoonia phaeophyticola TaxID=3137369 RepID=A0ABZ2V825_9RHOB